MAQWQGSKSGHHKPKQKDIIMKRFNELSQFERDCIIDRFCAEEIIKATKSHASIVENSPFSMEIAGEVGDSPMVKEPIEFKYFRILKIAKEDKVLTSVMKALAVSRAEKLFYCEKDDEIIKLPDVLMHIPL
jgi:hypothetical protein